MVLFDTVIHLKMKGPSPPAYTGFTMSEMQAPKYQENNEAAFEDCETHLGSRIPNHSPRIIRGGVRHVHCTRTIASVMFRGHRRRP